MESRIIEKRLKKLRTQMRKNKFDAFLLREEPNLRYFTGYTGESATVLVTPETATLVTDSRYIEMAQNDVPDFVTAVLPKKGALAELKKRAGKQKIARIAFEGTTPYSVYVQAQKVFEGAEFVASDQIPKQIRAVKEKSEIERIEKAMAIACQSMREALDTIQPGTTELDLTAEYEYRIRKNGGDGPGFNAIIARGPNAAIPHAQPGARRIDESELLLLDFGAMYEGYRSDLTRTYFLGKIPRRAKRLYSIVLEAQLRGIDAIKPGATGADADKAARDVLKAHHLASKFGHGLGHGVGLQIHESPGLSAKSKDVLKTGMVVTVEPGVYFPGWGGIRIEDMVIVTRSGHRVIPALPKSLDEIVIG